MSNFGAPGQSFFANLPNQNKNQTTPTPGSTPAPFGNLGANTTSSSAFGGAGAGNMLSASGTTTGTPGGIFGPGGSVFGGGGNTNTATSTAAGAGSAFGSGRLFGATPTITTGAAGPATGVGLFSNTSSNPGTSGTTTGSSLFGNTNPAGTNTASAGGGLFGFPKPVTSGGGLFGSGTGGATTAASGSSTTGGSLFSGAGNVGATGSTTPAATGASAGSSAFSGGGGGGGGGGGLFGSTKPADSTAKPAASTFFSPPTTGIGSSTATAATGNPLFPSLAPRPSETSTSSSAPTSTLPGGSLFRAPVPGTTSTTAPAASTQPAFSLGGSAATGDKAASTTGTAGGGLFGNPGAAANKDGKPEEKRDGASATLPTFSLGGQSTGTATAAAAPTAEKKDGPAAPSLFSGLGSSTAGPAKLATPLAGSTATPATSGAQALTTTTTSAISVPPPSMLKGKSIEEIINRWSTELESHVRDYNKFAKEVAVWDRALIENGNNLAALYGHVLAAEREQSDIDQSLDHIEQQERELTATVEMYEKQMADILGGQGGTLRTLDTGPADTERDKNYMLATELHNHLDDLSSSLTQLIESVNSMSYGQSESKAVSADDPMTQIALVLSNHLESLQWIDGASRELEEKVVEVEKRVKDVGGVSQGASTLGAGSRSRGFGLNR